MIKVIKTEDEYTQYLERINEIFDAKPGTEEGDELELLVTLVEQYEKKEYEIAAPDPISAIKFRMEQAGLKQADLVPYIGSKSKVSEVLSGCRALSLNMIRKLVDGLGIPAEVLIKDSVKKSSNSAITEYEKRFPFTEMFKLGWFSDFFQGKLSDAKEHCGELLAKFIGPFDITKYEHTYALNRKSSAFKENENTHDLLLAWRIRVMNVATKEKLNHWNKECLSEAFFENLIHLSYLSNGPLLAKEYLNKAGIHLIIEKHLDKTHLDGSSMFLPDGSPLIALTLRYDRLDSFWFTLCHELAHIKLHFDNTEAAFFDDMTNEFIQKKEREADKYAKEMLIPQKIWKIAGLNSKSKASQIKQFAQKCQISPAIPAGRIRFESKNYRVHTSLIGNGSVRRLFRCKF